MPPRLVCLLVLAAAMGATSATAAGADSDSAGAATALPPFAAAAAQGWVTVAPQRQPDDVGPTRRYSSCAVDLQGDLVVSHGCGESQGPIAPDN